MLFDTQSPGRRRFVQVTFASLAILMGGGLVLFGIGSNTGDGGLADALRNNPGSVDDGASKDAKNAQKALELNPKDVDAARRLAKANLAIASAAAFDESGNVVEDGGQELITAADNAWTKYLALGPEKPDASVAIQFTSFYALPGVAKFDQAGRALEAVLVTRKPTSGLYAQLAIYALASGNADKAKEARARALELAPSPERRTSIAKELDAIEKSIADQQKAAAKQAEAQGGGESGGTTPPLKTLPTLQ